MSKPFHSFFAALALALCLHAPSAVAGLIVSATQTSGAPGQNVDLTLTVSGGPAEVYGYQFNFFWDPAALAFVGAANTAGLWATTPPPVVNIPPDSATQIITWIAESSAIDFSLAQSIALRFQILNSAIAGTYDIAFSDTTGPSEVLDGNFDSYSFFAVSTGDPMRVTVTSIPEPGALSMLLAGLGIMAFVRRRASTGQA